MTKEIKDRIKNHNIYAALEQILAFTYIKSDHQIIGLIPSTSEPEIFSLLLTRIESIWIIIAVTTTLCRFLALRTSDYIFIKLSVFLNISLFIYLLIAIASNGCNFLVAFYLKYGAFGPMFYFVIVFIHDYRLSKLFNKL